MRRSCRRRSPPTPPAPRTPRRPSVMGEGQAPRTDLPVGGAVAGAYVAAASPGEQLAAPPALVGERPPRHRRRALLRRRGCQSRRGGCLGAFATATPPLAHR